jgi:RNA polymerase sigma-70 factor (sigma-E family)
VGDERLSDVLGTMPSFADPGEGVDMVGAEPASRAQAEIEALYREHVPGARRLGYLLTGNRELAEDLVHDAFIRVAGRLRQIREPEAFGAYLRRAVVNAVRSHYRHQAVADRYVAREISLAARETYRDPDGELRDILWDALQQLPERQREAIVCRFYLDMSERDTATVLECPAGTVKSSVSRGLDTLRRALGDTFDAGTPQGGDA